MTAIQPEIRFKILKDAMLREDIADAERRIVWFLLFECMNRKTTDCYPGDRTIAKLLKLNPGTVYRAKQRLRKLKIIDWKPDPKKNGASTYWFLYGFDCIHADVQTVNMQTGASAPTQTGTSAPTQTGPLSAPTQTSQTNPFYAKFGSPELDYWDAFLRKTTGKTAPRDRRGGWHFPTQWPKENTQ